MGSMVSRTRSVYTVVDGWILEGEVASFEELDNNPAWVKDYQSRGEIDVGKPVPEWTPGISAVRFLVPFPWSIGNQKGIMITNPSMENVRKWFPVCKPFRYVHDLEVGYYVRQEPSEEELVSITNGFNNGHITEVYDSLRSAYLRTVKHTVSIFCDERMKSGMIITPSMDRNFIRFGETRARSVRADNTKREYFDFDFDETDAEGDGIRFVLSMYDGYRCDLSFYVYLTKNGVAQERIQITDRFKIYSRVAGTLAFSPYESKKSHVFEHFETFMEKFDSLWIQKDGEYRAALARGPEHLTPTTFVYCEDKNCYVQYNGISNAISPEMCRDVIRIVEKEDVPENATVYVGAAAANFYEQDLQRFTGYAVLSHINKWNPRFPPDFSKWTVEDNNSVKRPVPSQLWDFVLENQDFIIPGPFGTKRHIEDVEPKTVRKLVEKTHHYIALDLSRDPEMLKSELYWFNEYYEERDESDFYSYVLEPEESQMTFAEYVNIGSDKDDEEEESEPEHNSSIVRSLAGHDIVNDDFFRLFRCMGVREAHPDLFYEIKIFSGKEPNKRCCWEARIRILTRFFADRGFQSERVDVVYNSISQTKNIQNAVMMDTMQELIEKEMGKDIGIPCETVWEMLSK